MHRSTLFLVALVPLAAPLVLANVEVFVDRDSAVYQVAEPVVWNIVPDGAVVAADYELYHGGQEPIRTGILEFNGNQPVTMITTRDEPGVAMLVVKWLDHTNEERRSKVGVVFDPAGIQPSMPRPDDFMDFWRDKIEELNRVSPRPQLTRVDVGVAGVEYWQITLANIRGSMIHGQLAKPAGKDELPALFIPQWAGVYPLQTSWVTDRAQEGWLVLNISAHDLPIDEDRDYYRRLAEGPLDNYGAIGIEDRETSYFLRMFLSCYRAVDYMTGRPDWNGETLAVAGGSQGGYQALVTAAFHPAVTAAMANVPAGCDLTGPEIGRRPGWPHFYYRRDGLDFDAMRQAAPYYDALNFAPEIACPTLVGVGLIDEVCPPEGIFAVANRIRDLELVMLTRGDHNNDENDSHRPYLSRLYEEWLPALREGRPVPPLEP